MTLAISSGILIGGAVYLMLRRDMLRIALGFTLLSHGVNLMIVSSGGTYARNEPFGVHTTAQMEFAADPLPQAFVLTAIVISFSISVLMFVTAAVGDGDDATRPELDLDKHKDVVL
ncbi:cation:proton antiporter subunit C [Corynebacteriaceae bacterium 6-324]|uniref:sodium:proton antiporter n=1 Tax=Corynebacterium sp. TaxID=1720 RepID=UPI0028A620CE|nr:cation:proton antiporter subunit C [Corynebacterium sp.]